MQWGTFSPILRTHASLSPYGERRIWAYPVPYSQIMRESFRQRYAMLPYIYTEGRRTYDTGIAFLRPLYYDWPEAKPAYDHKDEYIFGENLIVAPVVAPADKATALAKEKVWIPAGEWVEQSSGKHFTGPLEVERQFTIAETPLYFKAGAITPMAPPMLRTDAKPIDPLTLQVTPLRDGQQSSYTVYDDGNDAKNISRAKPPGPNSPPNSQAQKPSFTSMPKKATTPTCPNARLRSAPARKHGLRSRSPPTASRSSTSRWKANPAGATTVTGSWSSSPRSASPFTHQWT